MKSLSARHEDRLKPGLRAKAFTLVELLAAMVFMAIVLPVALEGLRIANRAGVVAQRKAMATRAMDRMLNEYVVMNQRSGSQRGTAREGDFELDWKIRVDSWREDTTFPMQLVTCEVSYPVQGREYFVRGSTLVPVVTR